MPMSPYYREEFGTLVFKNYSNTHETSSQISQAAVKVLGNVGTSHGNYVAATPQTFLVVETSYWQGNVFVQNEVQTEYYSFLNGRLGYSPGYSPSGAFSSEAFNTALSALYEQIRGSLDLSVDLAQSRQAKSMIDKAARGIANLARTFRKMRRSTPQQWGALWLEFVYGWRPLANSIYQTADALLKPHVTYVQCRGRAIELTNDRSSIQSPTFLGINENRNFSISVRSEVKANFTVTENAINSMAGYTSLNPASIAWELVPYSFVVDWFVNFGGYIRNLENALLYGQAFKSGHITDTYLVSGGKSTSGSSKSGNIRTIVDMKMSVRKSAKRRLRLNGAPTPYAPKLNSHLGSGRLLNAAALLSQLLPRR